MQSLPLTTERQQTEWKTIKSVVQSNNFPDKIITKLKAQTQKTHQKPDRRKQKQKMGNLKHEHETSVLIPYKQYLFKLSIIMDTLSQNKTGEPNPYFNWL
jgi:hypothetical protein